MAIYQASIQPRTQSIPELANGKQWGPNCIIRCNHPLALRLIQDALDCDPDLCSKIKPQSSNPNPLRGRHEQILVLDTCSVENWEVCIDEWRKEGGSVITLVSAEAYSNELELQLLYLGSSGVLTFDNLINNLSQAVYAVAHERLWIRREVLNLYVKRTSHIFRKALESDPRLTARENEVVGLLQRKVSNRAIAQSLSISERTAKFHISNILRKLNLASRRELQCSNPSFLLFYPDWLLSHPAANKAKLSVIPISTTIKTDQHTLQTSLENHRPKP